MAKGGGLLLLGAAGIAALAALRRSKTAPLPPPTKAPGVDLSVIGVKPISSDSGMVRRADAIRTGLMTTAVTAAIATGVASIATAIMTAFPQILNAIMRAVGQGIADAFSSGGGAFSIVFIIVIVAIIITTIVLSVVKELKLQFQLTKEAFSGNWTALNCWEFAACESWLKQLGVSYTVEQITPDYDMVMKKLIDGQWYNHYPLRRAITKVAMDPKQWATMQIFARLCAMDYFRRASRIMSVAKIVWTTQANPIDMLKARIPVLPTNGWGENPAILNYAWSVFPTIGDNTPRETDNVLAAITCAGLAKTLDAPPASLSDATAIAMSTDTFQHIQKNNQLSAIMAGISLTRFDPWEPNPPANPANYAAGLYYSLGLQEQVDFITVVDSMFVFNPNYWGFLITVDITAAKLGGTSITVKDPSTGQTIKTAALF